MFKFKTEFESEMFKLKKGIQIAQTITENISKPSAPPLSELVGEKFPPTAEAEVLRQSRRQELKRLEKQNKKLQEENLKLENDKLKLIDEKENRKKLKNEKKMAKMADSKLADWKLGDSKLGDSKLADSKLGNSRTKLHKDLEENMSASGSAPARRSQCLAIIGGILLFMIIAFVIGFVTWRLASIGQPATANGPTANEADKSKWVSITCEQEYLTLPEKATYVWYKNGIYHLTSMTRTIQVQPSVPKSEYTCQLRGRKRIGRKICV